MSPGRGGSLEIWRGHGPLLLLSLARPGTRVVPAPRGVVRHTSESARNPTRAGGSGADVARAPSVATSGASAAAGLVEAGPDRRPNRRRRVDLAAHATEDGRRSELGIEFVLRPHARRVGRGSPPR